MEVAELRAPGQTDSEGARRSEREASDTANAFAWGVGEDGQLGQGSLEDEHWPTLVPALDPLEVRQLVAGSRNSLAITEQGRVYTWGWNQWGTLGFAGENKAENEPQEVTGLAGKRIVQAAIGGWHCLAVDDTGQAFSWGGNGYGQCGLPSEKLFGGNRCVKKEIAWPRPCALGLKVASVSAGGMHSLVLTREGEVWTWGQPLVATGYFDVWKPHKVADIPQAVCAVAGAFHNLVLTSAGDVLAWGNGGYGQLGQGDTHNRPIPTPIQGLKGLKICQLAAGGWHSAAVTEDGQLYMWGRGEHGRLGLGTDNKDKLQPMLVEPLAGEHVIHVSCGGTHSAALTKDGRLYVMGRGEFGRLGHGSTKTSNRPIPISIGSGPKGANPNSPDSHRVSFSRNAFDGTHSDSESETPRRADEDAAARAGVNGDESASWRVVSVTCGGRHTLALAHPASPSGGVKERRQKGGDVWAVREGIEEEVGKGATQNGDAESAAATPEEVTERNGETTNGGGSDVGSSVVEGSAVEKQGGEAVVAGSAELLESTKESTNGWGMHSSQPVNVPGRELSPETASKESAQSAPENRTAHRADRTARPKPESWTPVSGIRLLNLHGVAGNESPGTRIKTVNPHFSPVKAARGALHRGVSFLSEDEDGDHDVDDVSSMGSQPGDRSSPLSILAAHDVPGCLEAWACNRRRGQWPEEVGIKGKQWKEDLKLAGMIPEH